VDLFARLTIGAGFPCVIIAIAAERIVRHSQTLSSMCDLQQGAVNDAGARILYLSGSIFSSPVFLVPAPHYAPVAALASFSKS